MKFKSTSIRLTVMIMFLVGLISGVATTNAVANDPLNATKIIDFNGDGKSDVTLVDPKNSQWHNFDFYLGEVTSLNSGASGFHPVVGNYDGDDVSDFAVCYDDPVTNTKTWHLNLTKFGFSRPIQWGLSGDIPVPGDYDGDSRTDMAVFRPSTGVWYIYLSSKKSMKSVQFGVSSDLLVPADYDGDGATDIAVMRVENSTWYILYSNGYNFGANTWDVQSGPKDIMVPADYDGDGRADLAVYEMQSGLWVILESSTGNYRTTQFGNDIYTGQGRSRRSPDTSKDFPMPGDFDGDGIMDLAVWNSKSLVVNVFPSQSSFMTSMPVGNVTSKPVSYSVVFGSNRLL